MKNTASSSNNLVLFPTSRIANPTKTALQSKKVPETIKEIKDVVHLVKLTKINKIMETMTPLIANGLAAYGINSLDESDVKHVAFMFESNRIGTSNPTSR